MIPEIMANVLNYFPFSQFYQLWDKEIDRAHETKEKNLKAICAF